MNKIILLVNDTFTNFKTRKMNIVALTIFLTILTPDIRISNLPAIRLEQIVVLIFSLYLIFRFIKGRKIVVKKDILITIYLIFPIVIVISNTVGMMQGYPPSINDFFEIYKVYIYAGIYLIFKNLIRTSADTEKMFSSFSFYTSITACIAVTQSINLFSLNQIYIPIIAPTQYLTLMPGYPTPRVLGLSSNSNIYSIIVGLGFMISLWQFLHTKEKKYLLFMALNLVANILTLSRSGFIFLIIGSSIILLDNLHKNEFIKLKLLKSTLMNRNIQKNVFIFLLALIMIFTFLNIGFHYNPFWRILRLSDVFKDPSWIARTKKWASQLNYFYRSPIFGIGSAKQYIKLSIDNEWLLLLRSYGLVGISTILTMFSGALFYRSFYLNRYRSIYVGIVLSMFICMIPGAYYYSFQLMSITMAILGGVLGNENQSRKQDEI